jgi:hypothetical protein
LLHFKEGDSAKEGSLLAQWDPYSIAVLSEKKGVISFEDMLPGHSIREERNASGGRLMTVIENQENLNPQIFVRDSLGKPMVSYSLPVGTKIAVDEDTRIDAGSIIAKIPRYQSTKTQDITGGLPRVAELFEARRPKEGNVGQMAKTDGIVSEAGTLRSKKRLLVTNEESGQVEEHLIPHGKHVLVQPGDFVERGQLITEGAKDPHEILEILGPTAVQEYLIEEIQKVYRLQGVTINDKHLEIVISRMLFKVRITDPGDTEFFWGDQVDRFAFMDSNEDISNKGGKPAEGHRILLGITKASLETDSFISAASFQETTRVLTNAATLGKVDDLKGFKENVIMGHLIPAGTGLPKWRRLKVKRNESPIVCTESKKFETSQISDPVKFTKSQKVYHKKSELSIKTVVTKKLISYDNKCPNCGGNRHAISVSKAFGTKIPLAYSEWIQSEDEGEPIFWCPKCSNVENAKKVIPSKLLEDSSPNVGAIKFDEAKDEDISIVENKSENNPENDDSSNEPETHSGIESYVNKKRAEQSPETQLTFWVFKNKKMLGPFLIKEIEYRIKNEILNPEDLVYKDNSWIKISKFLQ